MIRKYYNIYLVDDDDSIRRALKRLITSEGFSVEDFSSAQSFLDSVPIDSKGCLILDLRMPGIDGFALQEKLNESYYNLHIIFITAYAQEGDREYALKGGAFGFLQKPFHDQSLLELINKAIEQDKNR